MKRFCIGLLSFAPGLLSAPDGPTFGSSFPRFKALSAAVVWALPTNSRPASLWIYKVIPQTFPDQAVSNLMAMGSLTMQDRLPGALFRLSNKNCSRYLTIDPNQGRIEYGNEDARANKYDKKTHQHEAVEGVPNDAEAKELALRLLKQLGVQASELATKPGTSDPLTFGKKITRSYLDKARGVEIEDEVLTRGVFFNRQIDGVHFAGIGVGAGCEVEFGNHAKVAQLRLVWRKLQPYEHRKVGSLDDIARWIREGRAVMTHRDYVNSLDVKKLTIKEIAPLYQAAGGQEQQNFVYPFAQLEAVAELGTTNSPVQLYCPIISGEPATAGSDQR